MLPLCQSNSFLRLSFFFFLVYCTHHREYNRSPTGFNRHSKLRLSVRLVASSILPVHPPIPLLERCILLAKPAGIVPFGVSFVKQLTVLAFGKPATTVHSFRLASTLLPGVLLGVFVRCVISPACSDSELDCSSSVSVTIVSGPGNARRLT